MANFVHQMFDRPDRTPLNRGRGGNGFVTINPGDTGFNCMNVILEASHGRYVALQMARGLRPAKSVR